MKLVQIFFVIIIIVGLVAIFGHFMQKPLEPGVIIDHPPGKEWFNEQNELYLKNQLLTYIHLFSSLIFTSIQRYIKLHRNLGKIFLASTPPVAGSGLILGVVMPFGGFIETIYAVLLFVTVIFAALMAIVSIRRRNILQHKEWMIRLFAWAMSIATMRILLGIFFHVQPWTDRQWFAISLHLGLMLNAVVAELWIRKHRKGKSINQQ